MLVVSVVLVGGGLTIVTLTEQRDKRDADADLRRFAGNLTPGIAGVLGRQPAPAELPSGSAARPRPARAARSQWQTCTRHTRSGAATGRPSGPAPGVAQALVDAFNERGRSSAPAGEIVFVRAAAMPSGRRLILGAVPARLPADVAACRWVQR